VDSDALILTDGVHDVGDLHGELACGGHDEGLAVI
jgi:hypothetical protein